MEFTGQGIQITRRISKDERRLSLTIEVCVGHAFSLWTKWIWKNWQSQSAMRLKPISKLQLINKSAGIGFWKIRESSAYPWISISVLYIAMLNSIFHPKVGMKANSLISRFDNISWPLDRITCQRVFSVKIAQVMYTRTGTSNRYSYRYNSSCIYDRTRTSNFFWYSIIIYRHSLMILLLYSLIFTYPLYTVCFQIVISQHECERLPRASCKNYCLCVQHFVLGKSPSMSFFGTIWTPWKLWNLKWYLTFVQKWRILIITFLDLLIHNIFGWIFFRVITEIFLFTLHGFLW